MVSSFERAVGSLIPGEEVSNGNAVMVRKSCGRNGEVSGLSPLLGPSPVPLGEQAALPKQLQTWWAGISGQVDSWPASMLPGRK
jgi:hypothetical protein